uniref:Uncharacterized protein n=1 Tax=Rhizophora mucronata TaxID=61149 RepID=A0A2P2PBN5_RHIMU
MNKLDMQCTCNYFHHNRYAHPLANLKVDRLKGKTMSYVTIAIMHKGETINPDQTVVISSI